MSLELKTRPSRRARRPTSCLNCHERKVKCDLRLPCANCLQKNQECTYAIKPITHLSKPSVIQLVDRMSVEMDIYKQLEAYWRGLLQTANQGGDLFANQAPQMPDQDNLTPSVPTLFERQSLGAPLSEMPIGDDIIASYQASTVLEMFRLVVATTLPHYKSEMDLNTAVTFWKLLTRPILMDQEERFDTDEHEQTWERERRERKPSVGNFRPSYSSSYSSPTSPDPTTSCSVSESSTTPSTPVSSSTSVWEIDWSFKPTHDGFFVSPSGRLIDGMTDFLFIKDTSIENIVELLEYAIAYLRGVTLLGWKDVALHLGLNVERVLHAIILRRRPEIIASRNSTIPRRVIDCINLLCFWYGMRGKYAAIVSMLLLAHQIALDTDLHTTAPLVVSRVYVSLIWWARSNSQRDEFAELAKKYLPEVVGGEWMRKFAFVSSVVRSEPPATDEASRDLWAQCEQYINEAHTMAHMMEKMPALGKSTVGFFKITVGMFKAEIALRTGDFQSAAKQLQYIQKLLPYFNDKETFVLIELIRYHCSQIRDISSSLKSIGEPVSLHDHLLSMAATIPTMPVLPQPPLGPTPPSPKPRAFG